jgi:hypothetical protein
MDHGRAYFSCDPVYEDKPAERRVIVLMLSVPSVRFPRPLYHLSAGSENQPI